jgi:ATP-dependent helicase Lhr and Lhr-like helicase
VGRSTGPFHVTGLDLESTAPETDVQLDYVGSTANAVKVIAELYRGEKRLVFADSRRLVEVLGADLRARGVTTHLVHASLSLDDRRRAEEAFAVGRDCVIVSTSALELGIDVGDLDRVIQVNSPTTVAAFLQRLGRSGRRDGAVRNCLFLALDDDELLHAAGLLLAWSRGFVEPVAPPPAPRHILAQQLLALCLQEGRVGERLWREWLPLPALTESGEEIARYLVAQGFVNREDGMLFIGPEAEAKFGRRHFMELMAVFTAPPEFTVLHGREEIGRTDPVLLVDRVEGPRLLLLGGRSWRVTWTDWKRRRCFVEPADGGGRARRWPGTVADRHGRRRLVRDSKGDAGRAPRRGSACDTDPARRGNARRAALGWHRADPRGRDRGQRVRQRPALVDLGRVPGQRDAPGVARRRRGPVGASQRSVCPSAARSARRNVAVGGPGGRPSALAT